MRFDDTESLDCLNQGKILLCPTDTIWGLSCDATNADAVNKIIELKKRKADKSFILLASSLDMLGRYVDSFPNFAVDIIEFAQYPTTVVFPKGIKLPQLAYSNDGSIAIRMVLPWNEEGKFCSALIRKFKKPILSTSANFSDEPTPKIFKDIPESIKSGVDYIVPYFQQHKIPGVPSRIIKMNDDGTFKILR